MSSSLGAPEEVLLFYSGSSELNPPKPYMMSKLLYQNAGDGVFVITLNDPKRLNCMSLNLAEEIILVIEHAKRDDRCKVLVWTGAGRAFCAGGNFSDQRTTVPNGIVDGYVHAGIALAPPDISAAAATRAMIKFPKLSIAAVNGLAVGGGVNVAFVWHDMCFAAEEAKFRFPFGQLGLTPELGSSFFIPRIVGLARAKELLMLGKEFSAKRAHEMGLVNEVVSGGEVLARALATAKEIATLPQFALRESKRLINGELRTLVDGATEDEYHTIRNAFADKETQQAMATMMKKTSKL
jgi:2-(1,2-epoxy-1,2-dihydrophenyl)acetyl-CoA isomerase|eukprot:TRINITY_DN71473_c0_g1_i1.p1 TRINITY_DN71473_c0_g1~~TRINITY_DN71473_c0_g1_i1.p1  ORF type:complete len:295 (+),score=50.54 TRINITY_DN71473_c0_g1_i1:71-955(+)